MMRITPAARISAGLVILIISILILAQAIGLAPDAAKYQLENRALVANALAAQINQAIAQGDERLLQELLMSSVEKSKDIKSAAVRKITGDFLFSTPNHNQYWVAKNEHLSTPTQIRFPILMNGIIRAYFEITFLPPEGDTHPLFRIPMFVVLIIFVSASGFLGFLFYIKRALHHLDPSSVVPARVRNALNALSEGVLILDKREQIVLANEAMLEKLEKNEELLIGKKASSLKWDLEENQELNILPWLSAMATNEKKTGIRMSFLAKNNQKKIFSVNAVPILGNDGIAQGTITVFDDISELEGKSAMLEAMVLELAKSRIAIETKNKELSILATRDPLTNCLNRRALYEHINSKFDGARKTDSEYCFIMADIDHFKKVNDTYGHGIGDEVIKMTANTLKEVVREQDIVARMGGEEFCVILPGANIEIALAIAERCRIKIQEKITENVKVTASFGVTSIKMGANDPNELIHQADEALYFSKEHGRNQVTKWTQQINKKKAN